MFYAVCQAIAPVPLTLLASGEFSHAFQEFALAKNTGVRLRVFAHVKRVPHLLVSFVGEARCIRKESLGDQDSLPLHISAIANRNNQNRYNRQFANG